MKKGKQAKIPVSEETVHKYIKSNLAELIEIYRFNDNQLSILESNIEKIYDMSIQSFKLPKDDYNRKGNLWRYITHQYTTIMLNGFDKVINEAINKNQSIDDFVFELDELKEKDVPEYVNLFFGDLLPYHDWVDDILKDLNKNGKIRDSYIKQ